MALALVAPKKTFKRLAGGPVAWAAAVAGAECIHFHNHAEEWMCRVYCFVFVPIISGPNQNVLLSFR
jgi:hypothetical protein